MLFPTDQIWIVVLGFVIAFVLAFGIGANDVANSFGTSVGSKVLTLRQACILATVFETLGSVLIGAKVSDTIRKGVLLPDVYQAANMTNGPQIMMVGQLSSLSGACIWLLLATFLRLPVSGSHSIVGSMMGFAMVAQGLKGINWKTLGLIVSSWFISPALSGIVSLLCYLVIDRLILRKEDPLEPGLSLLPFIYSLAIVINVFSILISGPPLLGFNKIPLYGICITSIGVAIITILVVKFLIVPLMRKRIVKTCSLPTVVDSTEPKIHEAVELEKYEIATISDSTLNTTQDVVVLEMKFDEINLEKPTESDDKIIEDGKEGKKTDAIKDKPEQFALFSGLQILTAIFGSFAHGGNDVSNAIGPLIGIWIIGLTQDISSAMETPIWILVYGGVGISVGLWVWGRRVIKTIGDELTTITPSSGVCIEVGAAMTVLLASNIGIPISTTHCKIGSIVSVGRYISRDNVDWSIFRNIILAWVTTVPVSMGLGAAIMFGLSYLI